MVDRKRNADLSSMLDDLVMAKAKALLADALGSNIDPTETDIADARQRMDDRGNDDSDDDRPVRRSRKRGRGRAKVGYIMTRYGAKQRKGEINALIPTWGETFAAIKRAGGLITAYELEKQTGMPKKTIESSVFNLRQLNLIQSKPLPRKSVNE